MRTAFLEIELRSPPTVHEPTSTTEICRIIVRCFSDANDKFIKYAHTYNVKMYHQRRQAKLFNTIVPFNRRGNNGRNGSCLTWLATSLEEKRR